MYLQSTLLHPMRAKITLLGNNLCFSTSHRGTLTDDLLTTTKAVTLTLTNWILLLRFRCGSIWTKKHNQFSAFTLLSYLSDGFCAWNQTHIQQFVIILSSCYLKYRHWKAMMALGLRFHLTNTDLVDLDACIWIKWKKAYFFCLVSFLRALGFRT